MLRGILYRKLIRGKEFRKPLKRVGGLIEDEMRFIGSRQRARVPKVIIRKGKKKRYVRAPRYYDISVMEVLR